MKITYTENPLRTTVELDAADRELLWWKIKAAEIEELLFSVHCSLDGQLFEVDIARAKRCADPAYYMAENDGEKSKLDIRVDRILYWCLRELQSSHCGDCTCQPASCLKCRAEAYIGIDTISGVGKHELRAIESAFTVKLPDGTAGQRTIAEALEVLRTYKPDLVMPASWEPHYTQEYYDSCAERWKGEAAEAYEWLKGYKEKYFNAD